MKTTGLEGSNTTRPFGSTDIEGTPPPRRTTSEVGGTAPAQATLPSQKPLDLVRAELSLREQIAKNRAALLMIIGAMLGVASAVLAFAGTVEEWSPVHPDSGQPIREAAEVMKPVRYNVRGANETVDDCVAFTNWMWRKASQNGAATCERRRRALDESYRNPAHDPDCRDSFEDHLDEECGRAGEPGRGSLTPSERNKKPSGRKSLPSRKPARHDESGPQGSKDLPKSNPHGESFGLGADQAPSLEIALPRRGDYAVLGYHGTPASLNRDFCEGLTEQIIDPLGDTVAWRNECEGATLGGVEQTHASPAFSSASAENLSPRSTLVPYCGSQPSARDASIEEPCEVLNPDCLELAIRSSPEGQVPTSCAPRKVIVSIGLDYPAGVTNRALDFARRDARRMASEFRSLGFRPYVFDDKTMNAGTLLATLREEAKRSLAQDTLIVYFAGHGVSNVSGQIALVLDDHQYVRVLPIAEIRKALGEFRGDALLIVDGCTTRVDRLPAFPENSFQTTPRALTVLLANDIGGVALESEVVGAGAGLLTDGILTYLRASADHEGNQSHLELLDAFRFAAGRANHLSRSVFGIDQRPILLENVRL
jgi:hypothetical protein